MSQPDPPTFRKEHHVDIDVRSRRNRMERCPPPPPPTPPPPHFRPFYPLSLSCFCLLSFLLLAVWRVRLNSTLAGGFARSVAFGGTLDHEEWCPRVDPLAWSARLSSALPGPAQVRVALSLAELYTAYWPWRSLDASTHRARRWVVPSASVTRVSRWPRPGNLKLLL